MPARGAILAYVREKFGTEPEYPWARYPHYAVLRHQQGRKWYALIMDVPPDRLGLAGDGPVEIINLKSDGVLDLLISGTPGILPAYHMDKRHWVSILSGRGHHARRAVRAHRREPRPNRRPPLAQDAPCQMTSTGPGRPPALPAPHIDI